MPIVGIKGKRWFCCPFCKKALFPVEKDTIVAHLVLRCKACKHDIQVNIESQEPLSQEPLRQ